MSINDLLIRFCKLIFSLTILISCQAQNESNQSSQKKIVEQIGEYVVNVYEDKNGHLWFGTLSKGVARYDGHQLKYFTAADGLPSNRVVSIIEDQAGNLWFGSGGGIAKFDGNRFQSFGLAEGLCHEQVANLFFDQQGTLWIGTWGGVCKFDGTSFTNFDLPIPDVVVPSYQETENWVTGIMEDSKGNIWITRSGYGAYKFDPSSNKFSSFTKKDGLGSNCVQEVMEDRNGNFWFISRVAEKDHPDATQRKGDGGLVKFDGKTFTAFPNQEGLSKNDVYSIYEDTEGMIWIGATGVGVYRYDGKNFSLFNQTDHEDLSFGLNAILKDSQGNRWFGFSGGLFRLENDKFVNVTTNGPWPKKN